MEKIIMEFEPRVKELLSNVTIKDVGIVNDMINLTMDFLEDMLSSKNQLEPKKLLRTDKYHPLTRFYKDINLFKPFCDLTCDCWKKNKNSKD